MIEFLSQPGMKLLILRFVLQPIFFNLSVQGGQANLQKAGCFCFISFGLLKYPGNMPAFHARHIKTGRIFIHQPFELFLNDLYRKIINRQRFI